MKKYNSEYFEQRDILIPHLAQVIKGVMKKKRLKKVLDVGCGTGLLVKYLNENRFQAHGCDLSREAIIRARKINPKNSISHAPATKLPYTANSFDLVTSISTIEHLTKSEAKKFIKEARRVLNPKGYIFIVTPNFATPLRIIQGKNWFGYSDPTHINFFTPKKLKDLLEKKGFTKHQLYFKIKLNKSPLEKIAFFLFFSTPFSKVRNSIWILAQKNEP